MPDSDLTRHLQSLKLSSLLQLHIKPLTVLPIIALPVRFHHNMGQVLRYLTWTSYSLLPILLRCCHFAKRPIITQVARHRVRRRANNPIPHNHSFSKQTIMRNGRNHARLFRTRQATITDLFDIVATTSGMRNLKGVTNEQCLSGIAVVVAAGDVRLGPWKARARRTQLPYFVPDGMKSYHLSLPLSIIDIDDRSIPRHSLTGDCKKGQQRRPAS